MSLDTDVLIVGGGPIGLAAAIEARRAGWRASVLEPRRGPVDKACGEGLMPATLAALHRLGVDPDGHALGGIAYISPGRRVEHRFRTGPGRGVRRTALHAALLESAAAAGVQQVSAKVADLDVRRHGVQAAGLTARWLLGCDGLHSTVRSLSGLERSAPAHGRSARRRRFGLRQHFAVAPWNDLVEVHWSGRSEAYVTPVAEDVVGIALLGPPGSGFEDSLADFPELSERIAGVPVASTVRGAGPLRQRTRARTAGPIRLVGDAAGYVDALTGEGLRVGLAQARAVVAALEDPRGYERAWRSITRTDRLLTGTLVAVATSPARGAVVPLACRTPALFGHIVERLAS